MWVLVQALVFELGESLWSQWMLHFAQWQWSHLEDRIWLFPLHAVVILGVLWRCEETRCEVLMSDKWALTVDVCSLLSGREEDIVFSSAWEGELLFGIFGRCVRGVWGQILTHLFFRVYYGSVGMLTWSMELLLGEGWMLHIITHRSENWPGQTCFFLLRRRSCCEAMSRLEVWREASTGLFNAVGKCETWALGLYPHKSAVILIIVRWELLYFHVRSLTIWHLMAMVEGVRDLGSL